VLATGAGIVTGIDCLRINRLARTAGAPIDKGAGIDLFKKIGDRVEQGEPLFRIHAYDESEYDLAVAAAGIDSGYAIDNRKTASDENLA
jgi:thymidine phosphorylase